jgi:hypothetical protein
VGLVTARVLGSALGIAAYGFCTLDIIAAEATEAAAGREFLVATDARRKELYWARYSAAGVRLSAPQVCAPAALPAGLPVAGEGAHAYPEPLGEPIAPRYPSAATAVTWCATRLAAGEPLGPPDPLYLRRPDARVPGAPKSVLVAPASPGAIEAGAIGGSRGSSPRASAVKAPATESQGPQAIGGSRGSSPWAGAVKAPATESQGPQAIGGSRGSSPWASRVTP